jgi:hypothetical protein
MNKLHFAALLSAFSFSTYAQGAMPPEPPMAPSAGPSPSATAPAETPAPAQTMSVADAVAADFPKYDKDASGELSKAEFIAWISEAKSKVDGKTPDKKILSDAFIKADTDKNKTVSAAELTSFLS